MLALGLAGSLTQAAVTDFVSLNTREWIEYQGGRVPVHLLYPPEWEVQTPDTICSGFGTAANIVVTNVDHDFRPPDIPNGCTTAFDFRGLPDDLVVLRIALLPTDGIPPIDISGTATPLSLDDFGPIVPPLEYGAPSPSLWLPVVWDGRSYAMYVSIGADATARDWQAIGEVINSIRFSPGRNG